MTQTKGKKLYVYIYIHTYNPSEPAKRCKALCYAGFPNLMKLIEHLNILVWSRADMIYAYIIYKYIHLYNRYEDT